MNKVSAYIGFAIKSNKVIFGIDNLEKYNQKLYLIIVCSSANNKYIDFAKSMKVKTNCDILITKDVLLGDIISRPNCKIIGIKNKELAMAILNVKAEKLVEVI